MALMTEEAGKVPIAVVPEIQAHPKRWLFLAILFLVGTSSATDRVVISVLLESIKHEFHVSDTMLGLLSGLSFALFYSVLGLPVARLADRGDRRQLIAIALSVWSGMTMLCAVAGSFWQLLAARIGVGAGEAGATPPAQALIVDFFPKSFRARAIGIFATSGTAGYLLGLSVGSQLVAAYGWRGTLLALGLPGFFIALLVRLALEEPRQSRSALRPGGEDYRVSLRLLAAKPSFVRLLVGLTIYSFASYGSLLFVPTYLSRVLETPMTEVGRYYGLTTAVAVLVGSIAGGWLCDLLVRRDNRWIAWFPAAGFALSVIPNTLMFLAEDFRGFLWLSTLGGILLYASVPAAFAAVHAVCGTARRATAIAVILFFGNLLGFGLGPTLTGVLSDLFSARLGVAGLRYAVLAVMTLTLPTAVLLFSAAKTLPDDMES